MKAIELVADQLFDENADVEMKEPPAEGLCQENTSSSTNNLTGSSIDTRNEEFQMKFAVTGTSSRQHHSGRKKVVCISIFFMIIYYYENELIRIFIIRLWKILSLSKCWVKEHLEKSFSVVKKELGIYLLSKS